MFLDENILFFLRKFSERFQFFGENIQHIIGIGPLIKLRHWSRTRSSVVSLIKYPCDFSCSKARMLSKYGSTETRRFVIVCDILLLIEGIFGEQDGKLVPEFQDWDLKVHKGWNSPDSQPVFCNTEEACRVWAGWIQKDRRLGMSEAFLSVQVWDVKSSASERRYWKGRQKMCLLIVKKAEKLYRVYALGRVSSSFPDKPVNNEGSTYCRKLLFEKFFCKLLKTTVCGEPHNC